MKIALIGPVPPPNGGMAMQAIQLQHLLRSGGHEVNMIATNQDYRPAFIGHIPAVRAVFRLFSYVWLLMRQLKKYQLVHLMANSGWSYYLFVMPAVAIARYYRVPIVMHYHGGLAANFLADNWRRVRGSLLAVDRIIVPSLFLKQIFEQYNITTHVVPNLVDLSAFTFSSPKIVADDIHVIITRNLESIYDIETAIKAFGIFNQQFPHSRLSIAGSGECESSLRVLVKQQALERQVTFVGRLNQDQMVQLYHSANIMLNTSLVDNTPGAIIEALACGVIVVSTDVGGIPFLVEHEKNALLMPPSQPSAVAQQLTRIMQSPELAASLSRNGRALVSQFEGDNVLPKLNKHYQEIV